MRKTAILIASLILLPTFLLAQQTAKKKLTMRDMLSFKSVGSPVISRDGQRVAFTVAEVDFKESKYRTDIWIVDTAGGKPQQFTRSKEDESNPQWSPDGKLLAFLSNRPRQQAAATAQEGDEEREGRPRNQIWLMPTTGGEAYQFTDAEEGVIAYDWSPDGRTIVYLTREVLPKPEKEKKEKEKKQKIDAVVEDKEKYHREFWTIEIETKKAKRVFEGDYGIGSFEVSPDGKQVVYTTNYTGKEDDGAKFDIWAFSIADGKARQLTRRPGGERLPRWSSDGRSIAFLAPQIPDISYSQTDLFTVSTDGGEPQLMAKDFDRSVDWFRWNPDGKSIYGIAALGTYSHLMRIPLAGGSPEQVTKGEMVISTFDLSADGSKIAFLAEDAKSLPDLWLMGKGGDGIVRLTEMNLQLKDFQLAEQEVIRWKSVDGLEIESVLTKPLGYEPGKRYPLLAAVHGGPHGRTVNTLRQYDNSQIWAANGYAVFSPNFRGSSGYDGKFDIANRADLGGKDFQDIMTGIDHLIKLGIADGDKLGIFGGSYGGYMTDWAITQTDRFKAAISMYGIFSLLTDFGNSYIPSWEPNYLGGYYWDNLDIYLKRSAFTYVKNIKTPVLLLHGEADPNTFISNSKEMYTALTRLNKTVEFAHYPREGHGFREPNHRIDQMQRSLEWFNKYIKGETPETRAEFNIGEKVPAGDWEFEVTSANPKATYPGQATDGSFVEVSIMFKSKGRESKPLELRLDADDVVVLDESGRAFAPKGIPVEANGARALIIGARQFTASAAKEQSTTYVPLVLTFELPKGSQAAKLKLKTFPLVNFPVQLSSNPSFHHHPIFNRLRHTS